VQMADIYLRNNIWGSPKTCLAKLAAINDMMGADEFVAVFSYGAMPVEKAEASMRLFAEQVLPATQRLAPAAPPVLVS
jgi:alkanesulfonate monooxygenase SsuD/methylene tetrahydromethanopterin reductase-like flavin-dependent oxidoreductase (luciferase family)